MTEAAVVAVDWGTTSFRLWVLDRVGRVLSERKGAFGMSTLEPDGFEPVLEESLTTLAVGQDVPAIICGMAGAAQGWCEAAYADVPVDLSSLPSCAVKVPGIRRDVRILAGLAHRSDEGPDVMRGEETLLLGASRDETVSGVVCMPGTHSKWATIEAGCVKRFSTAMTGELFALLARHSTLSHFTRADKASFVDNPMFDVALREMLDNPGDLTRALFSIRAMPLVREAARDTDMSARLSGLLIGAELAALPAAERAHVTLISGGLLGHNYVRALQLAGIPCTLLEADLMARAGLLASAQALWPTRTSQESATP